ncbi:MAG TPA: hypothetical protein VE864_09275, partial [Streptosporangiaceae bacterium]|nr:hypothetical protein [Streptosporangiaceae bacterium]
AEVEHLGLWLACRDQTVTGPASYVLERFTELEPALAALADRADAVRSARLACTAGRSRLAARGPPSSWLDRRS